MIFKTDRDRNQAYRNTFTSGDGPRVLVDILGTLGFWNTFAKTSDTLTPAEQNILSLSAKQILEKCGFWKPENYEIIMRNMLGIIKPKRKKLIERIGQWRKQKQ